MMLKTSESDAQLQEALRNIEKLQIEITCLVITFKAAEESISNFY